MEIPVPFLDIPDPQGTFYDIVVTIQAVDPWIIRSIARRIHEHVATFGVESLVLVMRTPDPLDDDDLPLDIGVDVASHPTHIEKEASQLNS